MVKQCSWGCLSGGVCLGVSLKEISLGFSRLNKDFPSPVQVGMVQSTEDLSRPKGREKLNYLPRNNNVSFALINCRLVDSVQSPLSGSHIEAAY